MKIQVLGTGCLKCRKLKENAARAVAASGIECEVESVSDLDRILSFDVMMTPALVIDGEVKEAGGVPSPARIEEWLRARAAASGRRSPS
jgi:small redox-active disulfide protein 2